MTRIIAAAAGLLLVASVAVAVVRGTSDDDAGEPTAAPTATEDTVAEGSPTEGGPPTDPAETETPSPEPTATTSPSPSPEPDQTVAGPGEEPTTGEDATDGTTDETSADDDGADGDNGQPEPDAGQDDDDGDRVVAIDDMPETGGGLATALGGGIVALGAAAGLTGRRRRQRGVSDPSR